MTIFEARRTTIACPVQYEGTLVDGRAFYLRERHGVARLDVPYGRTVRKATVGEPGIYDLADFLAVFPELDLDEGALVDEDAWYRYPVSELAPLLPLSADP